MSDHFLDHEFTQPTELRDFVEWHQGIKHYGFWAIEIQHPNCLKAINSSKQSLINYIHPNYLRQAHITLSASGLIDSQHFTNDVLQRQIKTLKHATLSPFTLCLSEANSFTTAPYLSIKDSFNSLKKIREILHSISLGQDAIEYIPHVTLGFYDDTYNTSKIFDECLKIKTEDIEFSVTEIVFARYKTNEIQGRYQVLHRIPFNPPDNKKDSK